MKEQRDVGQLRPGEMADAEVYTIKSSQKEYSKQECEALQRGAMFQQVVNLQVFLLNSIVMDW